jgi:hypothetical protein
MQVKKLAGPIAACNEVDPVGLIFEIAHLKGTLSSAWAFYRRIRAPGERVVYITAKRYR